MNDPLELSAEQALAARAPLGDVCVLAGAGSGKTRVLTARFVEHALAHDLAPRRVAALTFTEKAAREMRKRIAAAFELVGRPQLRAEAEQAPISTLHAFCARLLRRNAVAAGLDPSFRVLDADASLLLEAETLERVAERLALRADAPRVRAALGRVGGQEPLVTLQKLLGNVRAAAGDVGALSWHATPGGLAAAQRAVAETRLEAQTALAAWPGRPAGAAAALGLVDPVLAGTQPPDGARRALANLVIGGKGSQPPKRAVAALKQALDALEAELLDVEGREQVLPVLRSVLVELDRTYAELKARRQALDFTDLERETVRLFERLAERGRPAEGLPAALLVDEHQDTNPVQEHILAAVRLHGVAQFSVGDPKQSIYRFRGADVGVLLAEQERVTAKGRRELRESYRATPELVAALNGLGARLFDADAAGVPFAALDAAGRFEAATAGAPPPVSFALLGRGEQGSSAGRRREAAYVAAWLRRIVDGKVLRRLSKDVRPLRWNDCAVLFRARTDLVLYEQGLTAAGIPFRVHRGRGYLDAEEIEALRQALRVVHNPQDEHALACLVRGPALGATDADLLGWFGMPESPWARLAADPRPRVRQVVDAIGALRQLSAHADLPEVLAATVERLGLLTAALAQHDGARRAANLRRAVALADDLAGAGRHDLPAFLRHLELLDDLEVEQAEAPALGADGDAVTLMTVHAAKGLEWPVVVLADAGRKVRGIDDPFLLARGLAPAVALRLKDALEGDARLPAGYEHLQASAKVAAAQESLRLLYVAMTRAEQHLLISTTHQGPTQAGLPKGSEGWARELFCALALDLEPNVREVPVGAGSVSVTVEDAPPELVSPVLMPSACEQVPAADAVEVERLIAQATGTAPTLGGTRYVVTVSELLTFAASPTELYRQRHAPRSAALAPRAALDVPGERLREAAGDRDPQGLPEGGESVDPDGRLERASVARASWDEPQEQAGAIDRAALGRAVHLAIERWVPGQPTDLDLLLAAEHPDGVPAAARELARVMLARFEASDVARALERALAAGEDARREAAFHARVRFPSGARVAGFEHLLVKGTVDLWLPRPDGLWIVDHKTNPPGQARPTPASLARHYAPQLRLYALAAERLLGRDVAGAALLLLDPGWGPQAVEISVDVSGPALEESRRLCQAFAEAERLDRWPADWRDLLR